MVFSTFFNTSLYLAIRFMIQATVSLVLFLLTVYSGILSILLKQGLCINLEEWDGEGDGREVQKGGDIWIPMVDSC